MPRYRTLNNDTEINVDGVRVIADGAGAFDVISGSRAEQVLIAGGALPIDARLAAFDKDDSGLVGLDSRKFSNSYRTAYPGFMTKRPLNHQLIPFGTATINELIFTGGTASQAIDTTVLFQNRPTTKLSITAAGTQANIQSGTTAATVTLDSEGQLLTSRDQIWAIKMDSQYTMIYPTLYIGDATYANFYTWDLVEVGRTADGWVLYGKVANGPTTTTGTPNLAAAVRTKIRINTVATIGVGNMWIAPSFVLERPTPSVVFTVDDGYTEWTWLADEAAKRGIPVSFGIAKDLIGTSGFLTQTEMLAIANHSSGLFELTNHALINDSYATIGLTAYMAAIRSCRDYLIGLGCNPTAANLHQFVQGSYDQTLIDAMKAEGFLSSRIVGGSNVGADTQLVAFGGAGSNQAYNIPIACNLDNTQNLSTVQSYITNAAASGTAFVMGHRFGAAAASIQWINGYDTNYGVLNLLDWLADQRDANGWKLCKWSEWLDATKKGSVAENVF